MSEENVEKTEEVTETPEVVKTEEGTETPEVEKDATEVEEKTEETVKNNNSDIFISEDNRFDIELEYYMDGYDPMIEGYDEEYYAHDKDVKKFSVTFKFPSQKDADAIMLSKPIENLESATYNELIQLENMRIVVLMREWTLENPIHEIVNMHPKIVKSFRKKLSNEIGGNGIF